MMGIPPGAMVCLVATVMLVVPLYTLVAGAEDQCKFPVKWQGSWFQSGFRQPITIEGSRLSTKGHCLMSEGDKFVVMDEKGCYRCVVIHEKHANVLQYKETYCHSRDNLSSLCSLITGDALLFSMFRIEAHPVACPFEGPFTFTYNRGHGDCRSPVSSIDSCTEESRLLLSYQACPDVHGTESTVEELQCLATWKEGSSRYLVGKVHHNHATSNEDRYRCFVYEKVTLNNDGPKVQQEYATLDEDIETETGVDYRIAQSGDATCNGLSSPMEGSRTMTLKRASTPDKCVFPYWLTSSSHWHTLNYTRSYSFHLHNTTLRIANSSAMKKPQIMQHELLGIQPLGLTGRDETQAEMRVVCTEIKQNTQDVAYIVTHFTKGCQSGFVCMVFYRRDGHVIEVQTGTHVRRAEDACNAAHFNRSSLPFVTLVTTSPEPRQCPYLGKFSVTGVTRDDHNLFRSPRSNQGQGQHSYEEVRASRTLQRLHRSSKDSSFRSQQRWTNYESNYLNRLDKEKRDDLYGIGQNHDRRPHDLVEGQGRSNGGFRSSHGVFEEDLAYRGSRLYHETGESRRRSPQGRDRSRRSNRDNMSLSPNPCADFKNFTTLVVGCSTMMDTMEFRSECTATDVVSAYSCHGRWEDNGTHYLITTPLSRSSHGARRYCFMYREVEGVVHFSSSSDSCQRNISPGVGGALAFNVTSSGQCVEANSAPGLRQQNLLMLTLVIIASTSLDFIKLRTIQR